MNAYVFYKNKFRLGIFMVFQTIRIVGTVGVAVLINLLIDTVSVSAADQTVKPLMHCILICCLYALALGAVIFLSERLMAANIKHIMLQIRSGIMKGILRKSMAEYQQKNSAEYIAFFTQNLGTFEEHYLKNLVSIYDSLVSIAIAMFLLFYINPFIAVISVAAMSIPSLIPKLFGKRLGIIQGTIMQNTAGYHAKIKDIFSAYEVIRTYRAEKQMEELHDSSSVLLESSKEHAADIMALLYGLAN
ncbi:MAG: hypothetical protein K2O13_08930, partial [Lachnospiraceae bacterium]|nr:hypothetical protein [Lachnospiraceae bacterium]